MKRPRKTERQARGAAHDGRTQHPGFRDTYFEFLETMPDGKSGDLPWYIEWGFGPAVALILTVVVYPLRRMSGR